jgi:chromosome segregation ATPase
MSDIERQNLDAHVSICEIRYQNLERRLEQVESQLESVNTLLLQIRDSLAQQPAQHTLQSQARWDKFQWYLIAVLGAVAGWALARLL